MPKKLVRDYVPAIIASKGEEIPPISVATKDEMLDLLEAKLREEHGELLRAWGALVYEKNLVYRYMDDAKVGHMTAEEVKRAEKAISDVVEEAADVLEVMSTMVSKGDILRAFEQKRRTHGDFTASLVLDLP